MDSPIRLIKPIFLGIAVLMGVLLFVCGVYGTAVNLYKYLVEHDLYTVGLFVSPILAVVGIGFAYIGTRYLDRAKTFLENAWLLGITMLVLSLCIFIYDAVTDRLTCDLLGLTLDITLVALGCLLIFTSRRKNKVQINTVD